MIVVKAKPLAEVRRAEQCLREALLRGEAESVLEMLRQQIERLGRRK